MQAMEVVFKTVKLAEQIISFQCLKKKIEIFKDIKGRHCTPLGAQLFKYLCYFKEVGRVY